MHEEILRQLFELNPAFAKTMKSKQYRYSKILIRMKHELGVNQRQMAQLLNLPYADYLALEFGSLTIAVNAYESVFVRLSQVTEDDIQSACTLSLASAV